jgi:pyruvate kinase
VQKRIIAAANARARPVVTATQMLESMVEHERPTRAEVSDVANAVLDGTDAVMLSAESAVGRHPVLAARMLKRVAAAIDTGGPFSRPAQPAPEVAARDALSFAACQLAERLEARAIVVRARELRAVAALARFRPRAPIVALAASERMARTLAVVSGVTPLYAAPPGKARARDWLYANSLAAPGDPAVLVAASAGADAPAGVLRAIRLR